MADRLVNGVQVYQDSAGFWRERPTDPKVDALQAAIDATAAAMPKPATTMPQAEKTGAAIGAQDDRFAKADHQHPRLTSTTYATLDASGLATVAFTRAFTNKPGVVMTEVDASGAQPLVCVVQSFVQVGGVYTGAVIKGYRSQILPVLSPVNALAILGAVISGVNAINTALSSFNLFGGSAAAASVSVIAVARSDVPAT